VRSVSVGRTPLQGASLNMTSPRGKTPDFAKPTSRLAFGATCHDTRGAIALATAARAIRLDRSAVIEKPSKLQWTLLATPSKIGDAGFFSRISCLHVASLQQ
jgi:hypothetical protein